MAVKSKAANLFNVHPGEGRIVAWLLLQYFLLGGAFNFVQTAAFPLFLVEFSAQTLPYVYIANAVIVAGAVRGNITTQKLEIRASGRVWGDVVTTAFVTEEGAFLRGQIRMEETVELELEPAPESTPSEAAQAEFIAQFPEPVNKAPQKIMGKKKAVKS